MTTCYMHKGNRVGFIWRQRLKEWFPLNFRYRMHIYDKDSDTDFGYITDFTLGPLFISYNHDPICKLQDEVA